MNRTITLAAEQKGSTTPQLRFDMLKVLANPRNFLRRSFHSAATSPRNGFTLLQIFGVNLPLSAQAEEIHRGIVFSSRSCSPLNIIITFQLCFFHN